MRRFGALLVLAAAIPAAEAWVPLLAGGAAQCAMACHKSAPAPGATCCLLGDSGSTLASCPGSRDGVPPTPLARMFPPNPTVVLPEPFFTEPLTSAADAARISRPSEPPDPVPLALS